MKENDEEIDFDDRISGQKHSVFPKNQKNQIKLEERTSENDNRFRNTTIKAEKPSLKNIKLDNKTKTAIQIIRYDSRNKFEFS